MSENKKTTAQLVSSVMGAIGGLIADKTNLFDRYDYISADNVLIHANTEMAKAGLSIIPSVVHDEYTNIGTDIKKLWFSRVEMQMILKGGSDEDSQKPIDWIGYGTDYKLPDKALYKAITSGHKYFMMKLFNIGVDNSVDNTDSEHEQPQQPPKKKQQTSQPKPKPQNNPPFAPSSAKAKPRKQAVKQPVQPQKQEKVQSPKEWLANINKPKYSDIQAALVMTKKFENENFAWDMIESFNYPEVVNPETGEMERILPSKDRQLKTNKAALTIFDWCLNNTGKQDE